MVQRIENAAMPADLFKVDNLAINANAVNKQAIGFDPRDHFLASYSFDDNTIELEDGSFWKVNFWDMNKIRTWAGNDPLTLTPNGLFGSQYLITNQVTGSTLAVDLIVGPIAFGPQTHWITHIDRWNGRVYLENGMYFDVRGIDQHLLNKWAVNDTIILGRGANEWLGHHDSILINVNMNHYVYANIGGIVWPQ